MPVGTRLTGAKSVVLVRNDNSSANITTSAYRQLSAALPDSVNRLYIFDSSGSALKFATGASGHEVDQFYLPPGGEPCTIDVFLPAGARLSVKAVDTNATAGQLLLTGIQ